MLIATTLLETEAHAHEMEGLCGWGDSGEPAGYSREQLTLHLIRLF